MLFIVGVSTGLLVRENEKRLRFGLVTDIHFAHRNVHGTRYYEQSITKLSEAIDVFNRRKLDFMIELGDLKDMGDIPERDMKTKNPKRPNPARAVLSFLQ